MLILWIRIFIKLLFWYWEELQLNHQQGLVWWTRIKLKLLFSKVQFKFIPWGKPNHDGPPARIMTNNPPTNETLDLSAGVVIGTDYFDLFLIVKLISVRRTSTTSAVCAWAGFRWGLASALHQTFPACWSLRPGHLSTSSTTCCATPPRTTQHAVTTPSPDTTTSHLVFIFNFTAKFCSIGFF